MSLENTINELFDHPDSLNADSPQSKSTQAVLEAIELLDSGRARICEFKNNKWIVNEWLKKAVLLYFRVCKMQVMNAGDLSFFDKIPLKKWTGSEGVRVVPAALVRKGAFIEKGAILMPSYVNLGAYVGSGTMVDTWATVGSCAQIGKNVHLSGGVGIGGVLEPVQASPVIIEDNCFIGSRCIIVEGVHIEEGSVIGAGVTITATTKIIDVTGHSPKEFKGHIPKNSVVIPGNRMRKFAAGEYGTPCALIIGQRSDRTDQKTSLTDALRDFDVSV